MAEEAPQPSCKRVIAWDEEDPENPYNWPAAKKLYIVFVGTILITNSTINSALPSGDTAQLGAHFNVQVEEQLILPTSIFLIGYILGPLVFAPLSEFKGRRLVVIGTFFAFMIFILVTCFSPNWVAFICFRLLTGVFGSTPLSVTGGLYADVFASPVSRGRAMAWFMTVASLGPALCPLCSAYLGQISWRWPFWLALIFAGASFVPVAMLPETYGPALLQKRARRIRKLNNDADAWAPSELEERSAKTVISVYFGRPFRMLFTEPIVTFSCMFLSLIYAIFFMFFQAFPIIFGQTYNFTEGEISLTFLSIVVGCLLAMLVYLWWDRHLFHAQRRNAPWTQKQEYKRLPLACIGGPFFTIGLFWIGWAARSDVHWIVPVLSGVPIGMGFVLVFIALINYMVDAYHIFAASALAVASITRSCFGVALPFATTRMYEVLGIDWACSLLGFLSLAMCLVPFAFIRFGERIRASSRICQQLAEREKSVAGQSMEERSMDKLEA